MRADGLTIIIGCNRVDVVSAVALVYYTAMSVSQTLPVEPLAIHTQPMLNEGKRGDDIRESRLPPASTGEAEKLESRPMSLETY